MLADYNDQNSLEVDPQLDSSNKPTNPEVTQGGKPDANGDSTSIGAVSPTTTTGFNSILGPNTNILGGN